MPGVQVRVSKCRLTMLRQHNWRIGIELNKAKGEETNDDWKCEDNKELSHIRFREYREVRGKRARGDVASMLSQLRPVVGIATHRAQ